RRRRGTEGRLGPLFLEPRHQGLPKLGEVLGDAGADQVAVLDYWGVDPVRSSVREVVANTHRGRESAASTDASRDQDPWPVADGGDEPAVLIGSADNVERDGIAPDLVGRPAPRRNDTRQIGCGKVLD